MARVLFPLLLVGISVLALVPSIPWPRLGYPLHAAQLIGHGAAFFVLTLAGIAIWRPSQRSVARLAAALACLAAGLELGQFLVPGRSPEIADFAAGLAGITFARLIGRAWCKTIPGGSVRSAERLDKVGHRS